jgi:hypothetical protein
MVEALVMYWKYIIRKQQLEKKISNCRKPSNKLPAHLRTEVYLQSNYDLLFYKTYRRNSSEYYFEKEKVKELNQLTESESTRE